MRTKMRHRKVQTCKPTPLTTHKNGGNMFAKTSWREKFGHNAETKRFPCLTPLASSCGNRAVHEVRSTMPKRKTWIVFLTKPNVDFLSHEPGSMKHWDASKSGSRKQKLQQLSGPGSPGRRSWLSRASQRMSRWKMTVFIICLGSMLLLGKLLGILFVLVLLVCRDVTVFIWTVHSLNLHAQKRGFAQSFCLDVSFFCQLPRTILPNWVVWFAKKSLTTGTGRSQLANMYRPHIRSGIQTDMMMQPNIVCFFDMLM